MKQITPIGDRVVVEPIVDETENIGGIVLPDSIKRSTPTGRVVAVGKRFDDKTHQQIPNEVAVGDVVLLPEAKIGEVVVKPEDGSEEKKLWIYRESDILGIVED